jgi:hypothetical protein
MLCVERLAAARAIPIAAHRFYTAKGPVIPPQFCRSLMAPKRTAPVGQVVASGITRAVTIILKELWPQNLLLLITGEVCAWPSGGAVSQGESAGKRPCPAPGPLSPQPEIRNPQSAIRIRNPQSVSEIRIVFFFLQGGYRAFLWQGLFAIRKIRTSVNPYRKSVIRTMNP